MNVVIRTDASLEIGTGHVMRCLTLAKQLEREGAEVTFICRDFFGNSISFIQSQGFNVHILKSYESHNYLRWGRDNWKQDAQETGLVIQKFKKKLELLIVDHYSLDAKWESEHRSKVKHILVIDDLADRPHDCDMLLDQNYYLNMQNRYKGLVPDSCVQLLGPNYVLLRDEFLTIDLQKIKRDGNVKNILIFFGGTDPTGETLKTLQAIKTLNISDIEFNVVIGASNPQKEKIEQVCKQMSNVNFYCQVNNMAELMVEADLAIGAGGTSSWERCFLGLPSILIIVAENQTEVTYAIAEKGAIQLLGESSEVTEKHIYAVINGIYRDFIKLDEMIRNCWEMVNPKVVKEQLVIKKIMELLR